MQEFITHIRTSLTPQQPHTPRPQVLQRSIVPPTPDASSAPEPSKTRQHCRQQLARLVRQAAAAAAGAGGGSSNAQVLLQPGDGGVAVKLPAALLALHSRLFFDMHQSGILGGDEGDEGPGGVAGGTAAVASKVSGTVRGGVEW